MTTPIIDPSTLTEEQREAIMREWCLAKKPVWQVNPYLRGRFRVLQDIFGKEFFEERRMI